MFAFVLVGLLGVWFHLTGNREFELEMDPGASGPSLAWEALRGATPTLAPSAMIFLGLLGLMAAWRHPALRRRGR